MSEGMKARKEDFFFLFKEGKSSSFRIFLCDFADFPAGNTIHQKLLLKFFADASTEEENEMVCNLRVALNCDL